MNPVDIAVPSYGENAVSVELIRRGLTTAVLLTVGGMDGACCVGLTPDLARRVAAALCLAAEEVDDGE